MLLLALIAAAQLAPSASAEMLRMDVPDEFVVGHHQRSEQAQITELVQPPETVERWSKMITGLIFFGGAQGGLDAPYTRWRDAMRKACPGLKDSAVPGSVDGHPAIRGMLACPLNPRTGKPEQLSAILVQGAVNLMMAQVAFRRNATRNDTALMERIARSLKVCDQRMLVSCSARQAVGFVAAR